MLFHKEIRKEVISLLASSFGKEMRFFNGRPYLTDLKAQTPLIAVHLDSADCEVIALSTQEWQAELEVSIFLPAVSSEDDLDKIASRIDEVIQDHKKTDKFETLSTMQLIRYDYEFDAEQLSWISATVTYSINYQREDAFYYNS